jgi:hypothetical protein
MEMAKPNNWESMTHDEQVKYATSLFNSQRGKYIIGQALFYAIEALNKVDPPYMREISNIQDMESLTVLFEPFYSIHAMKYDDLKKQISILSKDVKV